MITAEPKFKPHQFIKYKYKDRWYYNNVIYYRFNVLLQEYIYILDGPLSSPQLSESEIRAVSAAEDKWLRAKVVQNKLEFDIDSGSMYTSDGEVYNEKSSV